MSRYRADKKSLYEVARMVQGGLGRSGKQQQEQTSRLLHTGISSQIRTNLRDWAVWQAKAGCYSQAALSSNKSKTLSVNIVFGHRTG